MFYTLCARGLRASPWPYNNGPGDLCNGSTFILCKSYSEMLVGICVPILVFCSTRLLHGMNEKFCSVF